MLQKPLGYVAGPLTHGNVMQNIRRAILTGQELAEMGFGVFIPHLNCLWEMVAGGNDYEFWLDQDMQVLNRCDMLFSLDGKSPGRDREVVRMQSLGRPVIYTMEEAKAWIKTYEQKETTLRGN